MWCCRKLGLDVIELQADEALPEGVFVEDTAVICNGTALICRPKTSGRLKEVRICWNIWVWNKWIDVFKIEIIRTILRREGLAVVDIDDPLATIDGGDVLFTGNK